MSELMRCPRIKVLVVGEENVGKSNIALRFTKDVFCRKGSQVIPSELLCKTIEVPEKGFCQLDINDPFGEDRFRDLTSSHYRYVDFVVIVCDVTNRESFDALPRWIHEIQTLGPRTVSYLVVANKIDADKRLVLQEEGESFAAEHKCHYIEVSAMYNVNIQELFELIATETLEKRSFLNPASPAPFKQQKSRKRTLSTDKLRKTIQAISPRVR